jgi:glutathione S-transferase
MKLRYSNASPFVRKVLVFAYETGQSGRIELVPTDVWAADTDIARDNPLGKVPALVTDDGIFVGSTLCCEYLDSLHGGLALLPRDPGSRWPVLQRHALADGIIEAAVAHVVEVLRRPQAYIYSGALARQQDKIERTLDRLAVDVAAFETLDLSSVTLGCALGYLDFRLDQFDWRAGRPQLAQWFAAFDARPSMRVTAPHPVASPAKETAQPQ